MATPGEEPHATRLRSAGRPVVGVEAEVRRADHSPAEIGEPGEVWVRGPNIMKGYWNREQETEAVLDGEGWYHSGDAAYADAEGYLFIVDRLKDMIISGGENVYCTEVENAIYRHPAVLECAVFGVPDEDWGERVHAAIVLRPDASVEESAIAEHCRALIAGYKLPRSFDLGSEPLPKSGAGKILKRELRKPYWAARSDRFPDRESASVPRLRDVSVTEDPEYALSSSSRDEHERLGRQADWYAPFTRRLLLRAGVEPGMRVLDVGCGPGDVSFLLSELVGEAGSVLGVERDEEALARARLRDCRVWIANVEFVLGDFREIEFAEGLFDALVGRFVLMYQGDPTAAVASAARHIRPGGAVVFAEMCFHIDSFLPEKIFVTWPPTPAFEQLSEWCHAMHGTVGTQQDMGMRLPATFAEAGLLPSPDLEAEVAVAVGEEAIIRVVELTRSLLPGIVATGVATEEEVEIDTLAERLRADTGTVGRVVFWPTVVGATATKPL